MIKCLAHACFTSRDLAATQEFYCDRLGLTHAFDFLNDQGERIGLYVRVGGRNFLEFFRGDVPEGGRGQTSFRHICFEVDDVAATVAELRSRGVEVSDAKLGSDQSWQAWLNDPDGHRIELHGYTPQSRQTPWVQNK